MDSDKIQDMAKQGLDQLQQPGHNVGEGERWASLAGGAALAVAGWRRGGITGLALGTAAGMLLYRGATGHCAAYERMGRSTAKPGERGLLAEREIHIDTRLTVARRAEDLYQFWRDFERLPQFMRHIVDVTTFDERRSHWVAQAPFGNTVEWDAEVIEDVPNERIHWRSNPEAAVQHHGKIEFRPIGTGDTTEIKVDIRYRPPGGRIGATLARYLNGLTEREMQEDLQRFRELMEMGVSTETPTPPPPAGDELRH